MINNNRVDDDYNDLAKASLNQRQNVIPAGSSVPTSASSINAGTGTIANPGPAGYGGDDRPGRRLYNPLSKFSSSTYQITWYMLTPEAYKQFVDSGRKRIDAFPNAVTGDQNLQQGSYIIAQSGGIPSYKPNLVAGGDNETVVNRPPGFKYDFYIDNLKFKTATSSKTTGTSANAVSEITFQVIEPYGFSFITSIRKAAQSLRKLVQESGGDMPADAWRNFFVLGIRFTGYDKDGNIVKPTSELNGEPIDPVGADGALFENFYDFAVNEFKFKLDGKTVVYNIKGGGYNGKTLLGTKWGRIPTGSKFSGFNVDDVLQGDNGLLTHLNKTQQEISTKNSNITPSTYKIKYMGDADTLLGAASMATEADVNKWLWPGNKSKTTSDSSDAAGQKVSPNNVAREFSVNNDTSIIQAIEMVIKKSAFMVDALRTTYYNTVQPDTQQKNNQQIDNPAPIPFKWYNISTEISKATWNKSTNDWSYDITYIVSLYDIYSIETPYIKNRADYPGAYKRYDYLLTGKNSEIVDLTLDFNYAYFKDVLTIPEDTAATPSQDSGNGREEQTATGGGQSVSTGNTNTTSGGGTMTQVPNPPNDDSSASGGVVPFKSGQRTGGDRSGGLGTSMEAQNSAIQDLQDPLAYATASLKILGDPDFLVRDTAASLESLYNKYYDLQGENSFTINASGGQVFIEVKFKNATDYDTETGLLQLNENIIFQQYPESIRKKANGAIIWQVTQVDSTFNMGKFEQSLTLASPSFFGTTIPQDATEDATTDTNNKTVETNPDNPGVVKPPTTPPANDSGAANKTTTPGVAPPKNTPTPSKPAASSNPDPYGLYGRD